MSRFTVPRQHGNAAALSHPDKKEISKDMDLTGLQCSGCGSSDVEFDAKKRIMRCHTCGKQEYYSRATLNSSRKVLFSKQNAMRFFKEGKLTEAKHYALEVLNIFCDNAPSLFIISYYDEFSAHIPGAMENFFINIRDIPLEYEEVGDLRKMILASACNLGDFEEEIIQLISINMQSSKDAKVLCEFIDTFCPYQISRRTSANFLTKRLCGMYRDLAEHCGIPKTCFTLLKGIETNPDSPYVSNNFYLKAKSRYFYEHYMASIGDILSAISNTELKSKFLNAYHTKCAQYQQDAGLS